MHFNGEFILQKNNLIMSRKKIIVLSTIFHLKHFTLNSIFDVLFVTMPTRQILRRLRSAIGVHKLPDQPHKEQALDQYEPK
jgi:hypothetical protein